MHRPTAHQLPFLAALLALLLGGCETIDHARVDTAGRHGAVSVVFSDRDRTLIHDYYRHPQKRLPPGLAKREQLPPGLAKRQRLPPGLQGRHLPPDLERRLSHLPDGYVRLLMGGDVVLMERRSRLIVDLIRRVYQ